MDDLSDSALLTRWLSGDREAFAVIVARHHGLVQAACRRQAPASEIDDCVQAVFLILADKPGSAARAPVLAAWLQRVAWFVCRTARRSAQRRRQAEREASSGRPDGGGRNEALDHLDDCLLKLPARQREAVVLHFLVGKPAEEVAESLGTSRDNAYQLISRGIAALRALLVRRGIAVGSMALLSLLAAEAQAAGASVPAAFLAAITTAPSTGAAAIAQGAKTAMTITALTPVAAAAGLVLAAGMLTVALAAEQPSGPNANAPAPTPNAPTPNARPADANAAQPGANARPNPAAGLQAALGQPISVDFQDTPLTDAIAFIEKLTGLDIVVDPADAANATVTLKFEQVPVGKVLGQIEKLAGLTHSFDKGDVVRYRIHRPQTK